MSDSEKFKLGFISEGKLLVKFAFVQGQPTEVIIGRSASSEICLNNNMVSAQHAQLIFDANGNIHIIDLSSSNGTYLNNQRIEPGVPYQVRMSDSLSFSSLRGISFQS